MRDFRNLRVWRAAHRATLSVYRQSAHFPRDEVHGLRSQLRRAAASMGANIAEGCGRTSDADARRSFHYALASACEAVNHVILAHDLGLIDAHACAHLESELSSVRSVPPIPIACGSTQPTSPTTVSAHVR